MKGNARIFVDGREVGACSAELKIEKPEEIKNYQFSKSFEGTLENVEIGEEFLNYIEKQRKLLKMQKARERLYKNINQTKSN